MRRNEVQSLAYSLLPVHSNTTLMANCILKSVVYLFLWFGWESDAEGVGRDVEVRGRGGGEEGGGDLPK